MKKHHIFLLISSVMLLLFAILCISILAWSTYMEIKKLPPNASPMEQSVIPFGIFVSLIVFFPTLCSGLSFIRSTYKLLKYSPWTWVKVCYIISSSLALGAVAFFLLISIGWIKLENDDIPNYSWTVLLFTQWISLILSFLLGSIPAGRFLFKKKD